MLKQKPSAFLLKLVAPPFQKAGTEAFSFAQFRFDLLTAAAKKNSSANNPLMIRTRHWKFPIVLPMFRLSIIGA